MSVDKFGRHVTSTLQAKIRGPAGVGFKTTVEGDYDISSKRLRMVGEPKDENDAVTVQYVNKNCLQLDKTERAENFFNAGMRVIRNLEEPVEKSDAVNKTYIDERIVARDNNGWNFDNTRLVNVSEPKSSTDAVNRAYVDRFREALETKLEELKNRFEDEMTSLAYYLSNRLNDPLILLRDTNWSEPAQTKANSVYSKLS